MKGLLKKSGIDINLGRSCNLGCMFFYRQCKQQRDSGTSAVLIVIGLISYILINKRIAD